MALRYLTGLIVVALLQSTAAPGYACAPVVEVRFMESGGGDIFIIDNQSRSPLSLVSLSIQLANSRGRLVFDTADGGAGTSMHQPFEPVTDDVGLVGVPIVLDGSQVLRLHFKAFTAGRQFMFVIDLDDQLGHSDFGQADFGQAIVSGAEIEGAEAHAILRSAEGTQAAAKGMFTSDGRALLTGGLCV